MNSFKRINVRFVLPLAFLVVNCQAQDYYTNGVKEYFNNHDSIAIHYFDLAIENNQNLSASYMMRGAAKSSLGKYPNALSDLSISIELDTNNAKAYFYYGRVFYLQKFYLSTIKYYNKSLIKNPNDADVYDDRAICKFLNEDYAGSVKDENEAIRLKPNNAEYYNTRGFSKYKLHNYKGAINDFDLALKINPNIQVYANKGLALLELKDYEKAIFCFSNSLQRIKDDPEVLYYRGICFSNIGDKISACKDFRASYKLGYLLAKEMASGCSEK